VDGVEFIEQAYSPASAGYARPAPGHGRARHTHTIRRAPAVQRATALGRIT
jgi:hypothetical protein